MVTPDGGYNTLPTAVVPCNIAAAHGEQWSKGWD